MRRKYFSVWAWQPSPVRSLLHAAMTKDEIEDWLTTAHAKTVKRLKLAAGWWPTSSGNNQRLASAWCWAMFTLAARNRCAGRRLTIAAHQNEATGAMLDALWPSERGARTRDLSANEVLLDFSVHHWRSSNPVQLTAESEMFAHHALSESEDAASNDYSWDFYKLLVVPSQTRLFAARIGSCFGETFKQRRSRLIRCLEDLVDQYGAAFLRPHDELGAVILPTAKRDRALTRILWTDRGRLKSQDVSAKALASLMGES